MNVIQMATEFFQYIYETTRRETPEFVIHAWQDQVIGAFLNPTSEGSSAILAKEQAFQAQRAALIETYDKVIATLSALPENLQPAAMVVLSQQVPLTLDQLGLSAEVKGVVMGELDSLLMSLDTDPADVATVVGILQAQAEAAESTE